MKGCGSEIAAASGIATTRAVSEVATGTRVIRVLTAAEGVVAAVRARRVIGAEGAAVAGKLVVKPHACCGTEQSAQHGSHETAPAHSRLHATRESPAEEAADHAVDYEHHHSEEQERQQTRKERGTWAARCRCLGSTRGCGLGCRRVS